MAIKITSLPKNSILHSRGIKHDYIDSFRGTFNDDENQFVMDDMKKAFFLSIPNWVGTLMDWRDTIVSLFGLKTSSKNSANTKDLAHFSFEKGQKIGIFKVFEKTENEVIFGEDDKHLNFRISLFIEHQENNPQLKNVTFSSVVEFKNWFGRLYFLIVKPFHKLIVPVILKGIITELENIYKSN